MPDKWQDKIPPTQAVPAVSDDGPGAVILLITGEDMNGHAQWAYAKIPVDKFLEFKLAEESGSYSLSDYGEILASGNGAEPPPAIKQEMADKYNCNEQLEEEIIKAMEETVALVEKLLTHE